MLLVLLIILLLVVALKVLTMALAFIILGELLLAIILQELAHFVLAQFQVFCRKSRLSFKRFFNTAILDYFLPPYLLD